MLLKFTLFVILKNYLFCINGFRESNENIPLPYTKPLKPLNETDGRTQIIDEKEYLPNDLHTGNDLNNNRDVNSNNGNLAYYFDKDSFDPSRAFLSSLGSKSTIKNNGNKNGKKSDFSDLPNESLFSSGYLKKSEESEESSENNLSEIENTIINTKPNLNDPKKKYKRLKTENPFSKEFNGRKKTLNFLLIQNRTLLNISKEEKLRGSIYSLVKLETRTKILMDKKISKKINVCMNVYCSNQKKQNFYLEKFNLKDYKARENLIKDKFILNSYIEEEVDNSTFSKEGKFLSQSFVGDFKELEKYFPFELNFDNFNNKSFCFEQFLKRRSKKNLMMNGYEENYDYEEEEENENLENLILKDVCFEGNNISLSKVSYDSDTFVRTSEDKSKEYLFSETKINDYKYFVQDFSIILRDDQYKKLSKKIEEE